METRQLIDPTTGAPFIPVAHMDSTFDSQGRTVEQRIGLAVSDLESADHDLQADVADLQRRVAVLESLISSQS